MNVYPLTELTREVEAMPLADEQDLLAYLPLASRLAALGNAGPLARWRGASGAFASRVGPALIDRSRQGLWDLRHALGGDLGLAIIAAQDFHTLLNREREILPAEAAQSLDEWIDEAEHASLDADAVQTLETFLERFPIPFDEQLSVVAAPLTDFEKRLAAASAQPVETVELIWGPPEVATTEVEPPAHMSELALMDAEHPPDSLRKRFERSQPFAIPGVGNVRISRALAEDWKVLVELELGEDQPLELDRVRLGTYAGEPDIQGRWAIRLRGLGLASKLQAITDAPLVVKLRGGPRVSIRTQTEPA